MPVKSTSAVTVLTAAKIEPTEPALIALFEEVNEHLRSCDIRNMQVSVGFLGVMAIAASILAQTPGAKTVDVNTASRLVYVLLFVLGLATYATQRWYRVWKEHYLDCANVIGVHLGISGELAPYWLRDSMPVRPKRGWRPNFDNIFSYLTAIFSIGSALAFGMTYTGMAIPILLVVIALLLTSAIRLGMARAYLTA